MWNKIYLIALAVAVLATGVLIYLSYSWLSSVTNPADVVANYEYHSNLFWTFLFISFATLLVLGNVVLWLTRRAWTLWVTLAYFAAFVLIQTWWINNAFLSYQKAHNLTESTLSFLGLGGTILCIIVAVGVFFDQFIVLKMRDRIHSVNSVKEELVKEDVPTTDDPVSEEVI